MNFAGIILAVILFPFLVHTQDYTATNGSSFLGSLNVHNNPAAMVNSPFNWDLTLLGIQDKHATNAIGVRNYSLLSNPVNSEYIITNGRFRRFGDLNANINLFNTRIAINKRNAIAFGVNIRSFATVKTSNYNFVDTIHRFGDFFKQNEETGILSMDMSTSSWGEFYASYGRTIIDNEFGRLNAGVTLKINRGLSGAFASLSDGRFTTNRALDPVTYNITSAALDFGYSSNFDRWDSARKFRDNSREFLSFTEGGGSFDIGVEYLVKLQSVPNINEDDDGYFDYNWKIGLAVLDIGYAQYHFGRYSTRARDPRTNATDLLMDLAFDSTISNLADLKDSLSTIFENVGTYGGKFRVAHPTRLTLNVDKFITGAFYINADLPVNLTALSKNKGQAVKDLDLLTITGRWETRKKGYYFPVYFNHRKQLWIGGAVRFGPLLFGLHNLGNIFSKKKMHRGGGYLAFVVTPGKITRDKADKRLDCYW